MPPRSLQRPVERDGQGSPNGFGRFGGGGFASSDSDDDFSKGGGKGFGGGFKNKGFGGKGFGGGGGGPDSDGGGFGGFNPQAAPPPAAPAVAQIPSAVPVPVAIVPASQPAIFGGVPPAPSVALAQSPGASLLQLFPTGSPTAAEDQAPSSTDDAGSSAAQFFTPSNGAPAPASTASPGGATSASASPTSDSPLISVVPATPTIGSPADAPTSVNSAPTSVASSSSGLSSGGAAGIAVAIVTVITAIIVFFARKKFQARRAARRTTWGRGLSSYFPSMAEPKYPNPVNPPPALSALSKPPPVSFQRSPEPFFASPPALVAQPALGTPPTLRTTVGDLSTVRRTFVPSLPDELSIAMGDHVRVLSVYDDGWALCEKVNDGKRGVVPLECLGSETGQDSIGQSGTRRESMHAF